MHRFYLNDCLPPCSNQHEFIQGFTNTLREFNKLVTNTALNIEKAIVTEKLPSALMLRNTYSLHDSLGKITDHALKRLAFGYFTQYPVDEYFQLEEDKVGEILDKNYTFKVNTLDYDALNIAMVAEKQGFLFTVGLHDDLKKHTLDIIAQTDGTSLTIHNLYGEEDNSQVIKATIEELNTALLTNIEQLKYLLGNNILSNQFERDFPKLSEAEQIATIEHFSRAKNRGGVTPFFADGLLVKDVTPNNPKCSVFELRIFSPSAFRVFFNESGGRVFISHIFFKNETDQDASIKKAHNNLNKLILTS